MNEEIKKYLEEHTLSYNEKSSYIKKIICEILKYDENNGINQVIGEFYDGYLKKNFCMVVLEEFYLSPIVEARLDRMNEEEKVKLAKETFDTYIKAIVYNINNNDLVLATSLFYSMNQFIRRRVNYNNELMTDKMIYDQKEEYIKKGKAY